MAEVEINVKTDISDVEKDVTKLSRQLRDAKIAFKDLEKGTEEYAKKKAEIDSLTKSFNAQKDSLKDLKDAAKEQQAAFKKSAEGFAEQKEKMNDLKDEAILLQGSGIERLKNSFGTLTEGFENADFGKIKLGFKGLGAAMSALPMFLLIEAIKTLIENFDIVIEFAKSFTAEAKAQKVALDQLNTSYSDLSSNLDEIAFKQKELTRNIDLQNKLAIESAKQRGASAKEINALEIKGNEDKLGILKKAEDNYRKQKEFADSQYVKALKTENEDTIKTAKDLLDKTTSAYKSSVDARKDAEAGLQVFIQQKQTESYEKGKELSKKKADEEKKKIEEAQKLQAEEADRTNAAIDKEEADKKKEEERRKKDLEDLKALKLKQDQEESAAFIENERKLTETKKQEADTRYQIEKAYIQSAKILSDIFFQGQINAAEGDAKKQLEIKKRAFQVDKAFQASQATIDGYRAVLSAYASAPPGFKIASAAAAGILAAAQVAKILATKFNPGSAPSGGGSGTPVNTSSGGGSGNPAAQPIPQSRQESTQFDEKGNKITQQPIIVKVSEINDVQRNVVRVEQQSKF